MVVSIRQSFVTSYSCNENWKEESHFEIQKHPAWHEGITFEQAQIFLDGKPAFSYLLRMGQKVNEYRLSYLEKDGNMTDKSFRVVDQGVGEGRFWFHQNYCAEYQKTLNALILKMMHCEENQPNPVIFEDSINSCKIR